MTIVTRRRQATHLNLDQPWSQHPRVSSRPVTSAALKAGRFGAFGLLTLVLISHTPFPAIAPKMAVLALLVLAYLVVSLATGLVAAILADDAIKTQQQGAEVGWLAGFWAGIFSGMGIMLLAAQGALLQRFGQTVAGHFTPGQLAAWHAQLTPELAALIGRVMGALVMYGLVSALLTAALSAVAGMLAARLSA